MTETRAIRGGTVVTASEQFAADILIADGRVALVGDLADVDVDVDETLDASGMYVLPGAVDPHTHIAGTYRNSDTSDDFRSAGAAAACGGTTTVMDFCFPEPDMSLEHALHRWRSRLDAETSAVDLGVHAVLVEPGERELSELAHLRELGVSSVKLFLAYKGRTMSSDETLFRAMRAAAANGQLVMVHAENGDVIDVLIRDALDDGNLTPDWHARTRPPATEAEAVNRAVELAGLAGCQLYVVHVTCAEALAPIARARAAGRSVAGETCPHYLVLDESYLDGPGEHAAQFVCAPPLRAQAQQQILWQALADDKLSVLASDHCPFDLSRKWPAENFTKIVNGLPGLEQRLVLGHEFGVRAGHFDLRRLVQVTATNPARIFGLYPRKGTIAVGADADLVLFDPLHETRISALEHHSRVDHLPYEGMRVIGSPRTVLVRGEVVVTDGQPTGAAPGRYLECGTPRLSSTTSISTAEVT